MTKDVAVRETTRLDADQIRYIAGSNFVPAHYRGKLPEIMACIATGRELGLGDLESLRMINVIDGKPSMSAELMVKLVRRRGHSISGQVSDQKATAVGKRKDTGDEMTYTFTKAMADRAGLGAKSNHQKYPESMLWARAVSQLCRMLFPDCLAGMAYTQEEVEWVIEDAETDEATSVAMIDVSSLEDDLAAQDPGPEQEAFPIPESVRRSHEDRG